MKPSTDLVMQALGDEDGFKLAETLIKGGAQTQSALAENAEVSPQRAGEQLRLMRALGLVERERSARGKWSVTDRAGVAAVFARAAALAASLDTARARANEADRADWEGYAADIEQRGRRARGPRKAK
jgi:predicted transcriptional regulator